MSRRRMRASRYCVMATVSMISGANVLAVIQHTRVHARYRVPCVDLGILRCNDVATQKNVVMTHDARRPYVPRLLTGGSGTQAATFAKGLNRGARIGDGAPFQWGTVGMFVNRQFGGNNSIMMLSDEKKYS